MFKSTKKHKKYWKDRQIDWKEAYYDTWDHPHRAMVIEKLQKITFGSILEIGCASGPNLKLIHDHFPHVNLGGIDISERAIEAAALLLPHGSILQVDSAEELFFSDKSTDVVLCDASLIYIGPKRINKVMREIKRVTRNNLILVEFHTPRWWERLGIAWVSGYYAYDYNKLLKKHGFYDIEMTKIPEKIWGYPWSKWGYVITAKI